MTLETFFEKFDQFADAPGAVGKMRELVLHLAFSGKLLPAAEPWPLKPLKSLAVKIGSGATPAGGKESYFTEGIPLIRSMNVRFAGFEPKGLVFLSDEQAKQLANVTVQPGDVLLNITGASIGRVTTAPPEMAGARVNQHVAIIRPIKELDAQFLAKFLASPAIQRMIDYIQVGATREALTKGMIEHFDIPLPPLAEQKRIVAKVDELMALCDRLEAQQQERETRHAALARASLARFADAPTPANLNLLFHSSFPISPSDLRKSILTLAVQGKLVPQDPNDEPAEETFLKLAAAGVESEEDGFSSHWLRVPLGKIGEWRGGGTPSKSRPEFWKGDLPWVSPKDMKVLHIADGQYHISPAAVEGSSVRLIPPGSLLMVVRGMILARAFPVALTTREVTINQDMKALLPSEPKTKEYLLVALRAFEPDVLAAIEHSSHGTCKLKTEFLQNFLMPIPPLAEQRRIVAKVEQLMALVDELETQLAASRAAAEKLLSALVAELTVTTSRLPADS
jgi:type I restriction enzyme S subunit